MATAWVLGNGHSRREVDLQKLQSHGKIYGCNALYREFEPDVLVATDTPISELIQRTQYALSHCFYTRYPIEGLGAQRIPEDYFVYSSGPAAAGIAVDHGHDHIVLIGFDLGPGANNSYNNVYADTEFYRRSTAQPVSATAWIEQLIKLVKKFDQVQFRRVLGTHATRVPEFDRLGLEARPVRHVQGAGRQKGVRVLRIAGREIGHHQGQNLF